MARLWVVPANDLEALTITDLLGRMGERVLVTRQPWGASWRALEPDLVRAMEEFHRDHPDGVVYGVELAGPAPPYSTNIDHHLYRNDDRTSPLSSLEQVANLLGVELSHKQKLVAINDRAWIPGLLAAGASSDEIRAIRAADRAAQGLTQNDDRLAEQDLAQAVRIASVWAVPCARRPTSAHTDLLFERNGVVEPALLMGLDTWCYSGPSTGQLTALQLPEQCWSGGSDEFGYFGITGAAPESRKRILSALGLDVLVGEINRA